MRVLHIALNNLRQDTLCDALSALGEYCEIDHLRETPETIVRKAKAFNPDIVFMQLQGPVLTPAQAKEIPGYKINWTGDVRQPLPQWYIDMGDAVQLTLFTNEDDAEAMRSHGYNAGFLQIGFDENIFKRDDSVKKDISIVFMGNHYGMFPLSGLRLDMVNRLKATYGSAFKVFGMNWPNSDGSLMYNQRGECAMYQRAKIAINLSHFDLKRYSSDRIFRIMGSGTFCLTKHFPELERDWKEGKNVAVWHDLDDLMEKITFYINHNAMREMIANAGYMHVHKTGTWHSRIEELKKMIQI